MITTNLSSEIYARFEIELNRVKAILLELEESETLETISSVKAMRGHPGYFRIRIGDYRLGLKRADGGVRIIRFLSRGDIYRKFP